MYTYDWAFDGEPQHGIATLGRDGEGHYQMAWLDSWHNGDCDHVLHRRRARTRSTRRLRPGRRTVGAGAREFAYDDADQFGVVAWNVAPDGSETKATEARYARSA